MTDDQGKPDVDTPEATKGLDFLVNGFKDGYIPKEAITYKEEEGRAAFQAGKLVFHAPVALPVQPGQRRRGHQGQGQVRGGTAPGPGRSGRLQPRRPQPGDLDVLQEQGDRARLHQVLHQRGAAEEEPRARLAARRPSPTLYDDPALQEKYPYLPTLRDSINNAVPRPKVVRYGDATTAIQDAAYAALTGAQSTADALKDLQSQLEDDHRK